MSLLLDPGGGDPEALIRAAELAHWPLPRAVAVLALNSDTAGPLVRRLDLDALVGSEGGGARARPPGPGRTRPKRPPYAARSPTSLRPPSRSDRAARRPIARCAGRGSALELVRRDALPSRLADPASPTTWRRSLLLQDPGIARALVTQQSVRRRRRCLRPSASGCSRRSRAWLAHQRHTPRIAAELHVHPQTVRYRILKLRELLGDAIDTPGMRFELELALRARGALAR